MEVYSRRDKFLRLVEIERAYPGLFDYPTLCGEEWLLAHALDVSQKDIEAQRMTVVMPNRTITLSASLKSKEVKAILKEVV